MLLHSPLKEAEKIFVCPMHFADSLSTRVLKTHAVSGGRQAFWILGILLPDIFRVNPALSTGCIGGVYASTPKTTSVTAV